MVKGVSRQVIVVRSSDAEPFEQAIFILREGAKPVSDEMLLKEAKKAVWRSQDRWVASGPIWACGGAVCTAMVWILTALL